MERIGGMTTVGNGTAAGELAGKRALVTGGTRGIGAAIVRRLLDAGAEVLTTARSAATTPDSAGAAAAPDTTRPARPDTTRPADPDSARATEPAGARFVAADVRTRAGAEALAEAAREVLGGVDVLVHNAGGAMPYPGALAIPDEVWQDALDLNFLAAVRLDALLAPSMRDGVIVHVSSAAVAAAIPQFLHYEAAKAALENYSRGLAAELAPSGVRVNTISPGRVATPGGEATREQWAKLHGGPAQATTTPPLGRDGRPDDIAEAVLFLVSDRASWLTGSNIFVDGGEFSRS
jgi:NAD(P)-dependent dehydrogenase (short-subunit alcohol dehydrogenase family)